MLFLAMGGGICAQGANVSLGESVVATFHCEGKRGVLLFEGLDPKKEYQIGFVGGESDSRLLSDGEGKIEVIVYQHDRKKMIEEFQIRSGDFLEKLRLEWTDKKEKLPLK